MRVESSAADQDASRGASPDGTDRFLTDNVSSIAAARHTRAVDAAVRAYFDSLVMEDVPVELEQLVIGLR